MRSLSYEAGPDGPVVGARVPGWCVDEPITDPISGSSLRSGKVQVRSGPWSGSVYSPNFILLSLTLK